MEGMNSVKMSGFLMYPKLTTTAGGFARFTGRIAIPVRFMRGGQEHETRLYHNLIAWGATAEAMGELVSEVPIQIDGTLNTKKYQTPCKSCGSSSDKYWTEIQVNNFIIVSD